jgi:putative intracellular protease/amidase
LTTEAEGDEYLGELRGRIMEHIAAGKPVGALCYAPVILANAGVLSGKRATCNPAQARALTAGGALYTGRMIEQDGNIVTAAGPLTARLLGRTLVDMLRE